MALDAMGIGAVADFAGKLLDRFVADPQQKATAALELLKAQQSGELAQMANDTALITAQTDINKVEAANSSFFVSGARPFILWGCGVAMLYASMLDPIARFVAVVIFHYAGSFPAIDTTLTTQVLLGLLGLAGMRSYDKKQGTSK